MKMCITSMGSGTIIDKRTWKFGISRTRQGSGLLAAKGNALFVGICFERQVGQFQRRAF
jgi:hypothetical protein